MVGITYLIDEITSFRKKNNLDFRIELSIGFALISALISYYNTSYRVKKSAKQKLKDEENKNLLSETRLKISEIGISGSDEMSTINYSW